MALGQFQISSKQFLLFISTQNTTYIGALKTTAAMIKNKGYRVFMLSLVIFSRCCKTKETLYIGGLFGIDTSRGGWNSAGIIPAVQMAIDEINNNSDVLRNYHLELLIKDSQVCKVNTKLYLKFHLNKSSTL